MSNHAFASTLLMMAVFEEILGTPYKFLDGGRLRLDQGIHLRCLDASVFAHGVENALCGNCERVDRRSIFFFKPQSYCRFQVAFRRLAICNPYQQRQNGHHAGLFRTMYSLPSAVSIYIVPLRLAATSWIIPACTRA